jgi:hypothetical protein
MILAMSPFATGKWAESEVFDEKVRFIKLLSRHFRDMCARNGTQYRLIFSEKMRCFLFKVTDTCLTPPREGHIKVLALKQKAGRTVFKPIPGKSAQRTIQHWKHVAFRCDFLCLARRWYLTITPFWAFTQEGAGAPSKWQKQSSRNMKKLERNRAVLGHVLFWKSILCKEQTPEDDLFMSNRSLEILPPLKFTFSPSFNDNDWKAVATDVERQLIDKDHESTTEEFVW